MLTAAWVWGSAVADPHAPHIPRRGPGRRVGAQVRLQTETHRHTCTQTHSCVNSGVVEVVGDTPLGLDARIHTRHDSEVPRRLEMGGLLARFPHAWALVSGQRKRLRCRGPRFSELTQTLRRKSSLSAVWADLGPGKRPACVAKSNASGRARGTNSTGIGIDAALRACAVLTERVVLGSVPETPNSQHGSDARSDVACAGTRVGRGRAAGGCSR
eukprot:207578-Rhodomonas_salina.1